MKKPSIIIIIILSTTLKVFAQDNNYIGNWKIDLAASDFAGTSQQLAIPATYTIHEKRGGLEIIRGVGTIDGQTKQDTLALSFDSKPYESYSASHKKQVSYLHRAMTGNGFVLTINSFTADGKPYLHIIESLSLSKDGRTMSVIRHVDQLSDGTKYDIKGQYKKVM